MIESIIQVLRVLSICALLTVVYYSIETTVKYIMFTSEVKIKVKVIEMLLRSFDESKNNKLEALMLLNLIHKASGKNYDEEMIKEITPNREMFVSMIEYIQSGSITMSSLKRKIRKDVNKSFLLKHIY